MLPPVSPIPPFLPSKYGNFQKQLCLVLYAEEFIRYYAKYRQAALEDREAALSLSKLELAERRTPIDLFRQGTHMYELIASGRSRCLRPICPVLMALLTLEVCRTTPSMTPFGWYTFVSTRLDAADVLHAGSVEVFGWMFMTDTRTNTLWHRASIEVLSRHLYVERRLSAVTQYRLKQTLLEFLQLGPNDSTTGLRRADTWWTPEEFRVLVYRDLGFSDPTDSALGSR